MSSLPPVGPLDHARGPADAAVTIVQYGDYACPHTRASTPVVEAMLAEDPAGLRFVFRHFPLHHLHPEAEALALLVEAAGAQGLFWEAHGLVMKEARPDPDEVLAALPRIGVDREAAEALLTSGTLEARVDRDHDAAHALGVHSTPTFFFEGRVHDGSYDADTLRACLAEARRAR